MPDLPAFDHTSIAVRDGARWARWVRRELGATVVAGEVLPAFRYVLFYVGDNDAGSRLEIIDAVDPAGFLGRFLDRHGEGPHHITFTVPDVEAAVRDVRRLGLSVVNMDLQHPPWREAFVMPDHVHGCVIQLADSTLAFPPVDELLRTRARDTASFPGNRGAVDRTWWDFIWEEEPRRTAFLHSTTLVSTDPAVSRSLFGEILGGRPREVDGGTDYFWPEGHLAVRPGPRAGVTHLTVVGGPGDDFVIGSTQFQRAAA